MTKPVPREPVAAPEIRGDQFGVTIDERYTLGRKAITVLSEDDDNWFESMSFDAHWLPDLLAVLNRAMHDAAPAAQAEPVAWICAHPATGRVLHFGVADGWELEIVSAAMREDK